MVIYDLDLFRPVVTPPKYDSPLVVYSDRMLADEISAQRFKAISGRCHEVSKDCGVIQLHQFSAGDLRNIRRKPLWDASLLEYQRSERAAKASDHA
jgi:hypothetical protein